ncbi:MAG: Gfo/Idh/MocA family oxidoreductase, partial [Oceanipulchritudo sp.]
MHGWQNIEAWIASKPDKNADFWILDKERAGGGVVVSLLVHYIDLLRFLFGTDYLEVSARGRFDPPFKNGAESSATALLTTVDGATGTLHGNYLARRTPWNESFKAFGEYGVLGNHPAAFGDYDGPVFHGSSHGREPLKWEDQYGGVGPLSPDAADGLDSDPFVNQLREFVSAIREGREPESSLRINMNTLATIEALYESMANKGRAVEVAR